VELRNAVAIALDVIARGERGINQEAFVEDVLKRVAETSKKAISTAVRRCQDRG
jgi:hypothetical protein